MDKDKLNKDMNKMFQNKKFVNCLIVLLVIIFLWLAVSNFLGNDSNVSDKNNAPKGAQEVSTNDGGMTSKELLSYEEDQKKQLEDILSKMSGVGQLFILKVEKRKCQQQIQVLKHQKLKRRIQMEVQGLQSKKQKVQL